MHNICAYMHSFNTVYCVLQFIIENRENLTEVFTMNEIKRKLTSRKLWVSIASFVSMLIIYFGGAESEAAQVSALIMAGASVIGYVIGEGIADSSNSNEKGE